jgi:hypothetical protein
MIGLALTPEQFKTLLRMVYIANTVANAHRDDADFLKAYDDLEQYVFSRAKEAGYPAAVIRHQVGEEEHHHPSRIFEGDLEVNMLMDGYDLDVTIDLISEKLAERDVEQKYGPNAKDKMPLKDYEDLISDAADEYEKYFLEKGFKHISINEENGNHSA